MGSRHVPRKRCFPGAAQNMGKQSTQLHKPRGGPALDPAKPTQNFNHDRGSQKQLNPVCPFLGAARNIHGRGPLTALVFQQA